MPDQTDHKGTAFDRIPLVDISALYGTDEAAKLATAREMAKAASEVGFLYVTGHKLAPELIEQLEAQARLFYALPLETRLKYYIGQSRAHRGYVPTGEEGGYDDPSAKPDLKEAFDISIELPEDDPDHLIGYRILGPNQWPAEAPDFRRHVYGYYEQAIALGHTIFRGFALALGVEEDYFERFLLKPPSQLRLVHYEANAHIIEEGQWGISPHTDFECFTILHATTPGLQVLNAAGEWIEAPPVPGAFVINIGDMLEAMTNGRFIATPHRVRPTSEERFSFPLFCSVDYDTLVEPLPEFVGEGETPAYPPYVAGDHLAHQTMLYFRYLGKLVEEGKLSYPKSMEGKSASFGRKEKVAAE
ncbi:MAG: 2-oxoglutarate and iron-dependent oxygenase domain-containing protein [Parvibaculaceae bacterium]|nr:2-oxoglutarate and iron-dependent oxygenase domain-containing protein [Parvibaculaceae bacterium]